MRQFTVHDIRSWNPCYDPSEKFNELFTEDWSGTAIDFLKLDHIPPKDRLWVVFREDIIDDKTLRLFAIWCDKTSPLRKGDLAERYANGDATQDELVTAWDGARINQVEHLIQMLETN